MTGSDLLCVAGVVTDRRMVLSQKQLDGLDVLIITLGDIRAPENTIDVYWRLSALDRLAGIILDAQVLISQVFIKVRHVPYCITNLGITLFSVMSLHS